jgi:hypothetical protein
MMNQGLTGTKSQYFSVQLASINTQEEKNHAKEWLEVTLDT